MINLIVSNNNNPFDSIRHIDENNHEFWYARELMELLGYAKWQYFNKAIKRAFTACQNAQNDATKHFLLTCVKSKGRTGDDWKLSRLGCYLVAMNGDPTKSEIAQAQAYFAVKTREAEIMIPQQSERLKELELELAIATQTKQANQATLASRQLDHTMLTMHGKETVLALRGHEDQIIETEKPTIEVIDDRHNVQFKGQTLRQIKDYVKQKYGIKFKSGAEIKRFLEKHDATHLVAQTPRTVIGDYVPDENLEQVYRILKLDSRQMLIGE